VSPDRTAAGSTAAVTLYAAHHAVAQYVINPDLDPALSPRPYLHPVRTLAGTVVSDLLPPDHRWHLGAGIAMPDVAGANVWGGRSYVHGRGYVPLGDHGRIVHTGWRGGPPAAFGPADRTELDHELEWRDRADCVLLTERRTLTAEEVADGRGWRLTLSTALANPGDRAVELRSPAVNGRGDGAGYGGFFWRLAPTRQAVVTAGSLDGSERADGEAAVNGSAHPRLTVSGLAADGAAYTLIFSGLTDEDRWFVRLAEYPGVGVALAFERPLVITPGATVHRRYQVLVYDGPPAHPGES
jgi:hypothetical protein